MLKTRKFAFSCVALTGLAGTAMAQQDSTTRGKNIQRIRPVSVIYQGQTYPIQPVAGDGGVVVYENGTLATTGFFGTGSLPRQHVMDQVNFTPGPGAGSAVLITSMIVNLGTDEVVLLPNQNVELEVRLWNTVTPANTPVNTNEAGGGIRFEFEPPMGGWAINTAYISEDIDISMLPGGGLPTTSADLGVEFSYFLPGGQAPLGYNLDFSVTMWSAPPSTGPTVGASDPALYWRDANGDGVIGSDEARTFGTAADANFVLSLTGNVGGGGGCYANCDGSTGTPVLTANDFQCFANAFAAGSSTANCDGSTGTPSLTANDFQCFANAFAAGCS